MAFRRFGGINFAATNNIVHSRYSNTNNVNITQQSGQPNSKEVFKSHIDLSGNSILNTGCIYFQDGTTQCSASIPTTAIVTEIQSLQTTMETLLTTVQTLQTTVQTLQSTVQGLDLLVVNLSNRVAALETSGT